MFMRNKIDLVFRICRFFCIIASIELLIVIFLNIEYLPVKLVTVAFLVFQVAVWAVISYICRVISKDYHFGEAPEEPSENRRPFPKELDGAFPDIHNKHE